MDNENDKMKNTLSETADKTEELALSVMQLARDTITVKFRFFDTALGRIHAEPKKDLFGFMMVGDKLLYDPKVLLMLFLDVPGIAVRLYLHILMHKIFLHQYRYDKTREDYWNIACDIAVENIILEMNLDTASLSRDEEARGKLARIKKWCPSLTAEKLYREFLINGISDVSRGEYTRLFSVDIHAPRARAEITKEEKLSEEDWKKLSERIKADLKTFSKNKIGSESLSNNLDEATKIKYDYGAILEKFAVAGEEITVNDDEFDYIFYTYGLKTYGNMPLVEPLEYAEVKKVRDFVIAIDTSASCRGNVVKQFLQRTYDILKNSGSFFSHINVHIIECDAAVREDIKITNDAEFDDFIKNGKLTGFGATDFRPVFDYVDELIDEGAFDNLKGLIYFTDGYGIYPEHMPDYDVIFAFVDEDEHRAPVPIWAMKVIIDSDEEIK